MTVSTGNVPCPPRFRTRAAARAIIALTIVMTTVLAGCSDSDDSDTDAAENGASSAGQGMANMQTIRQRIIGNTVAGTMDPDSKYAEFYAPDGTIRGAGYQAAWRIENDRLCFDYDESPQVDCYAVHLDGKAVEWHLDGEIQGRGTIVEGNPNNF